MGPRLVGVDPARVAHGDEILAEVRGLTAGAEFTLARADGDPAGPAEGWPMNVVTTPAPPPGHVVLTLPSAVLAPGTRRLDVTAHEAGLRVGRDSIELTVVPVVEAPSGVIARGTTVDLGAAHAAPGVEVFLGGRRLAPAAVTFVSATKVTVTIPADAPVGASEVALRAGGVSGPPAAIEVGP